MSEPSIHTQFRGLVAIAPEYLKEKITLRHYELREDTDVAGSERTLAWEGDVRAMYRKYDQWVGVLGENDGIEANPIELYFVVRYSQNSPVQIRNLVEGDEADWQGRTFTISFLDRAAYSNGVVLYCKTKE